MSKNIRNTNKSVINIDTNTALTTYSKSANLPITWDPLAVLFPTAISKYVRCEKIGEMIFIKVEGFSVLPTGSGVLVSNTGVIPAEFRPLTNQICTPIIVNGYENPVISLRPEPNYNTYVGACILYTDGTLRMGAVRHNYGAVSFDGLELFPFQGPYRCGFLTQTLTFSYMSASI